MFFITSEKPGSPFFFNLKEIKKNKKNTVALLCSAALQFD